MATNFILELEREQSLFLPSYSLSSRQTYEPELFLLRIPEYARALSLSEMRQWVVLNETALTILSKSEVG